MAVGFSSMFFSGLASAFRLVIDLKVKATLRRETLHVVDGEIN